MTAGFDNWLVLVVHPATLIWAFLGSFFALLIVGIVSFLSRKNPIKRLSLLFLVSFLYQVISWFSFLAFVYAYQYHTSRLGCFYLDDAIVSRCAWGQSIWAAVASVMLSLLIFTIGKRVIKNDRMAN